ncbi:MAG TPA: Do family serine endopeptidase [Thermoanaerobaculia bacterium]|nr:Do family serine endopeptidase [Thermoanaerobaculia bacterium]
MQKSTKQALSFSVLIAGAVIFGMVVAGAVNVTPRTEAQREAPAGRVRPASVVVPSFADIADGAMPSVVSITSTETVKGSTRRFSAPNFGNGEDPFEFFFGQPRDRRGRPRDEDEHREQQSGTGFLISEDGYSVTNYHVIDGAEKIEVRHNKERFTARVVGKDPATDLALLKIDSRERFLALPLGDSDRLRVGEWVMAIGDPIIFDKTVTVGVVSAKDRQGISADQTTRSFENFIQTDAAINLGNSGGPLINVNGEVIGINTAIYRPAQNIGFAVPVNTLRTILPQLKDKGKVVRGYLGINIENVDADKEAAFRLKSKEGAFVQSVLPGEPADTAGVKPGDTIVRVDSVPVKDTRDLIGYVSSKAPGSKVKLTLMRDGREITVNATLAERQLEGGAIDEKGNGSTDEPRGKIGISVAPVTPQIRKSLGLETSVEGLYVEHVKEVSPAYDANIRDGDIITQVNGHVVTSTDEFAKLVKAAGKGEYLRLYVFRPQAKASFFALVKIGE